MSRIQSKLDRFFLKNGTGPGVRSVPPPTRPATASNSSPGEDDDDAILARALEESEKEYLKSIEGKSLPRKDTNDELEKLDLSISALDHQMKAKSATPAPKNFNGFDMEAGRTWIYPTNYPMRDYQFSICRAALFENTLVSLPTGLGKTFIAAVVMYNFYRWYPGGKVIFMAHTRPLVAQQIEACFNIMGIPQSESAEITGSWLVKLRQQAWKDKRVFFVTPQVLNNDVTRGTFDAASIKCLVIDEAHKALKRHAYCEVVKKIREKTENFRILALSATPGSELKSVTEVLKNLLISHIELRGEDSIDVARYTHKRSVEKIVVKLEGEIGEIVEKFYRILKYFSRRLIEQRLVHARTEKALSQFSLVNARETFRKFPPPGMPPYMVGAIEGDFAICISLCHALELLTAHGLRPFFNFLVSTFEDPGKSSGKSKAEVVKFPEFAELMDNLRGKFAPGKPFQLGHPKMSHLRDIVVGHFQKAGSEPTRAMIFCQYRDTVQDVTEMLHFYQPLVRPMAFVGQSVAGSGKGRVTQKEQLRVVKEFSEGGYNVLIATCVGEEGLDIQDVDLIICYDSHKSPVRLVQRMGRTGRKREGKIVMLVTEGKEENSYNQSLFKRKNIAKEIVQGEKLRPFLYQLNPRMIPDQLNPVCVKQEMDVGKYNSVLAKVGSKKKPTLVSSLSNTSIDNLIKAQGEREANALLQQVYLSHEENEEMRRYFPFSSKPRLNLQRYGLGATLSEVGSSPLSNYTVWQTTPSTRVNLKESSSLSSTLVKALRAIEINSGSQTQGDLYGDEMKMYLNMDDVLLTGDEQKLDEKVSLKQQGDATTSAEGRKCVPEEMS
ncbi:unnamed protein product [Cyprideis torosa]|uniref:Fanconi anemia group M protein n=1 Tax=Cyprideis torosa TaxID=163714 RepID=A0A7R8WDG2_9CRUS|nr:unnamed protein product [Cyprideis torosa]CAG0894669.1 unnamed protein product [Cyprideis torosa]